MSRLWKTAFQYTTIAFSTAVNLARLRTTSFHHGLLHTLVRDGRNFSKVRDPHHHFAISANTQQGQSTVAKDRYVRGPAF